MFLKKLIRNEVGDTIVEVLLAIAVVSTILGGSYVVANKSIIASREAQERGVALKLTESQLERLKAVAASSNSNLIFGGISSFCIKTDNTKAASSSASCKVDSDGAPAGSIQPAYTIVISRDDTSDVFTITTTWPKFNTNGTNTVKIVYKVYQQ